MMVYVARGQHNHERDFLDALAGTLHRNGHAVTTDPGADRQFAVVWNGRGWAANCPTLYCECGWLPRWAYQVSHTGINAASHLAPVKPVAIAPGDMAEMLAWIEECRTGNPYNWPYLRRAALPPDLDAPSYILLPLQMPGDTNMDHVAECRRTPEGLVTWAVKNNPSLPLLVKVHPACRGDDGRALLALLRPQDRLVQAFPHTIHDLLASGRIASVLTANSNTFHDALLWGVPATAADAGIWGSSTASVTDFDAFGYMAALRKVQWTLDDAHDAARLRLAMRDAIRAWPGQKKTAPVTVTAAPAEPLPVVNVCVGDRGWLFNDLAQHLKRQGTAAKCDVHVTEQPEPDAAAYLYMRADEARECPHPERSVCQVHDQWGNWRGRFDGCKVAGWSLTHPAQFDMLCGCVDLRRCKTLTLPIGAPEKWIPRRAYDRETFTAAWVGRAVAFKRVGLFVQACADVHERIPGFRAVLLGENLEPFRGELTAHGVPVELRTKAGVGGYEHYESQYQGFDAVVICSDPQSLNPSDPRGEAHPLPLFEALACGVPVVASYVGYAPLLATYLFRNAKGLRGGILDAYHNRERDFAERQTMAKMARQWSTLESWCRANLKFAMEVAQWHRATQPRNRRITTALTSLCCERFRAFGKSSNAARVGTRRPYSRPCATRWKAGMNRPTGRHA
jgi:glycosyltransferase involved in cell wall biosynthesis